MANPYYILHLSDTHFKFDGKKSNFEKDAQDKYIKLLRLFLENKGRSYFNMLCITGDVMDKYATFENPPSPVLEYDFEHGIKFINRLIYEGLIKVKTGDNSDFSRIYSCPGNHDIDFDIAFNLPNINTLRKDYLNEYKIKPLAEIVDKNLDSFCTIYSKYKNFLREIKASNLESTYSIENKDLYGCDMFSTSSNQELFISWFNTSWLCLKAQQWLEIAELNDKVPLKHSDHEIISPGHDIYKSIFKTFDDNQRENVFYMSISHHEPRLLSLHDKSTNLFPISYMQHLDKYDLILNGHTHNRLFDRTYSTSGTDYIPIVEINFNLGYRQHYDIEFVKSDGNELIFKNNKIIAYNNNKFYDLIRSNYNSERLISDLNSNLESILNQDQKNLGIIKYSKEKIKELESKFEIESRINNNL